MMCVEILIIRNVGDEKLEEKFCSECYDVQVCSGEKFTADIPSY